MRRDFYLSAALVVMTLAAYAPVAWNDFVIYDDDTCILSSPIVNGGLSPASFKAAFSSYASNWIPLTWLSLAADYHFFGPSPLAFHLHNVLLHAAAGVLLFWVLRRMTGRPWLSVLVAALFLVHPAHVESVAWAAERKDVLSTLFWMLTMLAYTWYAARPGVGRYLLVLLALALGLMAKSMLVTLPLILLLMDIWPLGRLGDASAIGTGPWWRRLGRLAAEKAPLLALAAACGVMTLLAQRAGGSLSLLGVVPLGLRVQNALVSSAAYIGMMFWPAGLAGIYPLPTEIPLWKWLGATGLLMAVTAVVAAGARRRPYLAVGWFWYIATLVPVIGLVHVGLQSMADRYTYVPFIGLFIMIAWGAADLAGDRPWRRWALAPLAGGALAACMALTAVQVTYWSDAVTQARRAVDAVPDNFIAHSGLGIAYEQKGRTDEAVVEYRRSLALQPMYYEPHFNLAVALEKQGKPQEAIAEYIQALRLKPVLWSAYVRLGKLLASAGRTADAVVCYEELVRLRPDDAEAHNDLGSALMQMGQWDRAAAEYRKALDLSKDYAAAHSSLGAALANMNQYAEALHHCAEAVRLAPDDPVARFNLGMVYGGQGKFAEAAAAFQEALRLQPDYPKARAYLAQALAAQGK
jgi:Flp pilus assembly protein TadD